MIASRDKVDAILDRHGTTGRESLIPILQEVQEEMQYMSPEAISAIGQRLNLPASKVYGVATFYNQFRFERPGRFQIQVCRGTACHVNRSAAVLEALQRELNVEPGRTTRDGLFSLEVVACIGACGLAPVVCIDGEFHAGVTPEGVKDILDIYRNRASEEICDDE